MTCDAMSQDHAAEVVTQAGYGQTVRHKHVVEAAGAYLRGGGGGGGGLKGLRHPLPSQE